MTKLAAVGEPPHASACSRVDRVAPPPPPLQPPNSTDPTPPRVHLAALLALLCGCGAALAAEPPHATPAKAAAARPSSVGRQLKGFILGHGLLASHVLNGFAHRWFVRRGITPFGGAAAFATATASAPGAPSVDPWFSGVLGTDAFAAARAIAGGRVDMDSAAWSLASAAAGGSASAVGDVFAATAGLDGPSFTNVYARAAAMAMAEGGSMRTGFQAATAAAFASAGARGGGMAPFALAAAEALVQARRGYGPDFYSEFTGMVGDGGMVGRGGGAAFRGARKVGMGERVPANRI
jgi:hypothetical protein